MRLEQQNQTIHFQKGATYFDFLQTGNLYEALNGEILINQLLGNTIDGSINTIALRIHEKAGMRVIPLVGHGTKSQFAVNDEVARWSGEVEGICYQVNFRLATENIWFWEVTLQALGKTVDVIYGQDISLANKESVLANELYMSQYLDHKVIEGEWGYVVSSRQNQLQGKQFPYLQQGGIGKKITGYSTDGTQFFGLGYKGTHKAIALDKGLVNVNYQYELSYTALQTEQFVVNGKETFAFYGIVKPNYEVAVKHIDFQEDLRVSYAEVMGAEAKEVELVTTVVIKDVFGMPYTSPRFTEKELERYFPERHMEELDKGTLLSFFAPGHRHIVLPEKELMLERPHGHIITSGLAEDHLSEGLITSTNYMYGVFNSQLVVGNTSHNKLLSTTRGLLNLQKNSGQRIYIKINDTYSMLTLPAAYELGVNYAKWYYKVQGDVVTVVSYAAAKQGDIVLEVTSEQGKTYEMILTNQLVLGEHEFKDFVEIDVQGNYITITGNPESFTSKAYPELNYRMIISGTDSIVSDDRIFFEDAVVRNGTLLTIQIEATSKFQMVIEGRLKGVEEAADYKEQKAYTLEKEIEKFNALYNRLTCGFNLALSSGKTKDIEKINEIFWWYTHNAMTHFAVPHGLEQPGGAAWGTRDICQGPIEYFFATQHFSIVKEIIEEVFAHQMIETGEWPQWFMFDCYRMQQDDCHGDVIFWPLKVVGDYIHITGDSSILDSEIIYRYADGQLSEKKEKLLEHMRYAIASIRKSFIYETALISYNGGDWDDTLQPANKALKEKLVSAWTVALAYQTLEQLGRVLAVRDAAFAKEIQEIATDIKKDFSHYLIKDGVIAGFAYCESAENMDYMLHPKDKKTGIKYRLLPMTRSIISELVSKEQAIQNVALIKEHLKCPDGVRLMNYPATYKGGVVKFFQRAEQAANVGREIGLNYIHAHIRYIEAVAKLGDVYETWDALMTINPINIKDKVSNAVRRQSNSYFSSSDGAFNDRYAFQENFNKLRTGEVDVKGGWRIYSSGPGIYLNQIISNILGLRLAGDKIILDPVLPFEMDGLEWNYMYNNKPVTFIYHIGKEAKDERKIVINGQELSCDINKNSYRSSGYVVEKDVFEAALQKGNIIHLYV